MKKPVEDVFVAFTSPIEGVTRFMYLDVKGLVTTGIGNLIDPSGMASNLDWRTPEGNRATADEITAEWFKVKSLQSLKMGGGGQYSKYTRLRLSDEGLKALVEGKLAEVDKKLAARFPNYPGLPCDAQLALISMSWAMGTGFKFPKFEKALAQEDFLECAVQCTISTAGNPGVEARNVANRILFRNAAYGFNRDELYYPKELTKPKTIPPEAEKHAEITIVKK